MLNEKKFVDITISREENIVFKSQNCIKVVNI